MKIITFGFLILLLTATQNLSALETRFVFLVTGDGIRHQELFTGVDQVLIREENKQFSGIPEPKAFETQMNASKPEARREKLLPFFWRELASQGIVLGNRSLSSLVSMKNPHRFSYPGYAEILNGQHLPEVTSNDPKWSPRQTVMEFIRSEKNLKPEQVASFGSWSILNWFTRSSDGSVFSNGGYLPVQENLGGPQTRYLNQLQTEILSPWDSVRHDSITFRLALDYIEKQRPAFFYLSLGETDDWAHDKRYDRTVQSVQYFDSALKSLWNYLQSSDYYRGKSTMIITTDHGRGRSLTDWVGHGKDIPGSEETWIAIIGPDTPRKGELSNTAPYYLSNIAATILKFYGLDSKKFNPQADGPIQEAFGKP